MRQVRGSHYRQVKCSRSLWEKGQCQQRRCHARNKLDRTFPGNNHTDDKCCWHIGCNWCGSAYLRTTWKHWILQTQHTWPPVPWLLGASSPGIKRPEREADQSPSFIAGVSNVWSYTSTPPHAYMVCVCVNSFTLYLCGDLCLSLFTLSRPLYTY